MADTSPFPPACAARFLHVRRLAEGGFGSVHLARQIELDRPAAIKLLHPESLSDAEQRRRFESEARITARLSHPNVVSVLDFGVDSQQCWIAYEYLPGLTLRDRLRDGPMAVPDAVAAVVQIARALEVAHAAGVLHRDVKPDNVLATEDGRWKVTDFGIARWAGPSAARTQAGVILGTPGYIAPECILGGEISQASDIYALGVVLFELLVGRPPFTATAVPALLRQHLKLAPPPPSSLRPGIPAWLDQAVLQALAKAPRERTPSAARILEQLEPGLPETSNSTETTLRMKRVSGQRPAGPAGRTMAAGRRPESSSGTRAAPLRALALGGLLLAFGLSGGRYLLDRPRAPTPESPPPKASPAQPAPFEPESLLLPLGAKMKEFSDRAVISKESSIVYGSTGKHIPNLAQLQPLALEILAGYRLAFERASREKLKGTEWLPFLDSGLEICETFGNIAGDQVTLPLVTALESVERLLAGPSPDPFRRVLGLTLGEGMLLRRERTAKFGNAAALRVEQAYSILEKEAAGPWSTTANGLRQRTRLLSFVATAWEKASFDPSPTKGQEILRALAARRKILELARQIVQLAQSTDRAEAGQAMRAIQTVFNASWRLGRSTDNRTGDLELAARTLDMLEPFVTSGQVPDALTDSVIWTLRAFKYTCAALDVRPPRLNLAKLAAQSGRGK